MKKIAIEESYSGISSSAVKKKTGKGWMEWISILDKEEAIKLPHKEIAILLSERYKVADWWCQTVTVGYEKAKGRRKLNEKESGFEISVSKVLPIKMKALFDLWNDDKKRRKWLTNNVIVHKSTPPKSLRMTWEDGVKAISVNFYEKSEGKSQVTVQHGKLKDENEAKQMKALWQNSLGKLALLI